MGLFDELRRLTRPYEEDDDFFDEADTPAPLGGQGGSGFFGRPERQSFFAEENLDEQDMMMDEPPPPLRIRQESRRERKPKAAPSYGGGRGQKVVLITPMHFEDGTGIANHLKDGNTVIMNIENTDKGTARRMLDFLSGVAYTLGGKIQKVSGSIFLIMPHNADVLDEVVMGQFSSEGSSGYSF